MLGKTRNTSTLTVAYSPDAPQTDEQFYGRALGQIRIEAPCPLPITSTGYLSHLTKPDRVYDKGGPAAFVLAWLDAATLPVLNSSWRRRF